MLRNLLVAASVAGLAAALPQDINFAEINQAATPTAQGAPLTKVSEVPTYKPSVAAAAASADAIADPVATAASKRRALVERNACDRQPSGSGPSVNPDTAEEFVSDTNLESIADNAPVPQGYSLVFSNVKAATQQNGYMGFYTLTTYNTVKCQQYCDAAAGCQSFNIYIERDPSLDPADACPNPPSTTNYKCSLYGLPITQDTATNDGQWRNQFHVVITGSNGYSKLPSPPAYSGFTGPTALGGAIQAPNSYIGQKFYPGPYDPSQCASACQATTQFDREHIVHDDGTYDACNFFVSFVVSKNNDPQGTYCAMYTKTWDRSYGTNTGQYDNEGNYYSVSQAYSYALSPQDPGHI